MKKSKVLLATAAVATAFTCMLGFTACKDKGSSSDTPDKNSQTVAIYQLYSANAQANGETALTYEQWLESIKGPQGATGATGKSAYEIAKENGFEGTEAEWLESLKGTNGTTGTNGKSAYEIAKENGFEGTEAEWLESLKGEKGDSGDTASAPCVEGIYQTSDGLVVKFTDGTVRPVQNVGSHELLVLGDTYVKMPSAAGTDEGFSLTVFSFYSMVGGNYKISVESDDVAVIVSNDVFDMAIGYCSVGVPMEEAKSNNFNATAGKIYGVGICNVAESEVTYKITIEKA